MSKSGDSVFDIRDFISELFCKWKRIVFVTVLIAILIVCFGAFRKWRQSESDTRLEQEKGQTTVVHETRARLNDAEAAEVEKLYEELLTYQEYRAFLQKEFSGFSKIKEGSGEQPFLMKVSYKVTSALKGTDKLYKGFSLSESDMDAILEILPDVDSYEDMQKYIAIDAFVDSVDTVSIGQDSSAKIPDNYIMTVSILGQDKDTCRQIWQIVDSGLQREHNVIKKVDSHAAIEKMETVFSKGAYGYNSTLRMELFNSVQMADTAINNLKNNAIDKLSNEQKEYYNALRYPQINSSEDVSSESPKTRANPADFISKKLIVLGIILGLFFSCGFSLLRYLSSGVIHVVEEMEIAYRLPVLAVFNYRSGKKNLFSGIISKLKRADSASREVKAAVTAAELNGMIRKADIQFLYLLRMAGDMQDQNVANLIIKAMKNTDAACEILAGNPAGSASEMTRFLGQDDTVLLVHARKTAKSDLTNILKLCDRHSIHVLGTVFIKDI